MKYDLGFLGGGQLARMSIQAAQRMGLKCLSLDPGRDTPASQVSDSIVGALDDPEKIAQVFSSCGKVTLENEFIPAGAIREAFKIAGVPHSKLVPNVETLASVQDKLLQRHALRQAGVPSPKAVPIEGNGESAIAEIGFPMVLKARFGGYDGKGTRYARSRQEMDELQNLWKTNWLAEEYVPFERELAAMVYVSEWGAGCFPTMETIQTNHVCDLVFPAGIDASEIALAAVEAVGGNGLFGVEMFQLKNGELLVNEIAPRPHNTGHYTLDWGSVSQFEQHVRSVMGFPLGEPESIYPACMANLLGVEGEFDLQPALRAALADPAVHVHWYGKSEMRKGRKMGHINVVGAPGTDSDELVDRAVRVRKQFWSGSSDSPVSQNSRLEP